MSTWKKRRNARWGNPIGLQSASHRFIKKLTWKKLVRLSLLGFGASLVGLALIFAWYAKDLPTPGKIRKHKSAEATQILDRNGNSLFAVFDEEKRLTIAKENIPEFIKEATVAVEDKNFYTHHGIDLNGIIRGVILKPLTGQRAQGGSTITQQYVKNALLSSERTVDRKIKELILSLELEALFSKEDILAMYLNEIPYGSNAYGVEAAAQTFLNKPAKDLSLAEAATLAALPQRPTYLSPYGTHTDELLARKNFILSRMVDLNFITQEEAEAAKNVEVAFVPRRDQILAPHFVMYVRDQLVEKYGEQLVLEGGLRVTTTLDLETQKKAEEAIDKAAKDFARYDANNAALVAVDPTNGQVMAMVGSADYFNEEIDGNFNVATALRQPGSSFKPIAYATAFKGKWSPSSTLWDVPTDFGNYKPQNYDGTFRGPVTIRAALANSLNIPAVKALALASLDETIQTAQDFGITSLTQPERYGLSLVLGGAEVRPLELAAAYGVFANLGEYEPTTSILSVVDSKGRTLEEWQEKPKKVLSPEIAYEITHILIDNEARTPVFGPRSPLYFPERPVAAKTGTTQEYKDAWTVGYTPSLATAVWVGNTDNTPMNRSGGVRAAGPVFHDFMTSYYKGKEAEAFPRPEGIREVTVDALSGKLPTDQSPQTITDIFAQWQVPQEHDDIHVTVDVNKATNKIATELTPPDLIEKRVYTTIHSERPKDPRWEEPVLTWARDHGFNLDQPPEDKDDTSPSALPTIKIISPQNGSAVSGVFTILAEPTAPAEIRSVDFYVDSVLINSVTSAPWSVTYDATKISQGNHEIYVEVIDRLGSKAHASQLVVVASDETPPRPVSDATTQPGSTSGTIKLTWQNPPDTDLTKVRVYRSTTADSLGTLIQEVPVTPAKSGTVTIAGNLPGTIYYFTLRSMDFSLNEDSSTTQTTGAAI